MTTIDSKNLERTFNWFIILLIISLIGNACADFALLWFCIGKLGTGSQGHQASHFVSSFYFGQAMGAIFLAPLFSGLIDKMGRRFSSIAIDGAYAFTLALMLLASIKGILSVGVLFPFGAITASLGALHRGAIGFGAIKMVSEKLQVTKLVAKFNTGIYTTNLLGSLISGLLFRELGLSGCLVVALITFIPMPFIYLKLFQPENNEIKIAKNPAVKLSFLLDLKEGFSVITKERMLWVNSLVVSIWNIASNIFPGLVGIAFQKIYPGRSDLAAVAVSIAILAGAISFSPMEKISKKLPLNKIMLLALMPAMLGLILCFFTGSSILLAVSFLLHCVGATLVNISSGSLRVSYVSKNFIARINTTHSALVASGQMLGSLFLIPILSHSTETGALIIFLAYLFSLTLALVLFPKISLGEALKRSP